MAQSFADWHWPLPAGDWRIDRGPCGAPTPNNHTCDYYEHKCGFDLAALTGDTEHTPVLAPLGGRVVFLGNRPSTGIEVLLEHNDGRISALYHLSKAVVEVDQQVQQGEVVGYIGHTGASRSRLHFHIQPNVVTRQCIPIEGLDAINYPTATITSHNTDWKQLVLVNPPQPLLDRLPPVEVSDVAMIAPTQLSLTLNQQATLWVRLSGILSDTTTLRYSAGILSTVLERTPDGPLFKVLFESFDARTGQFPRNIWPNSPQANRLSFGLSYTIKPSINLVPANSVILLNPTYMSPTSYSRWKDTPQLCWSVPGRDSYQSLEFRVHITGPQNVTSEWLPEQQCWQPPILPKGVYFWKVVVRNEFGYMNRPNQRPLAFSIYQTP